MKTCEHVNSKTFDAALSFYPSVFCPSQAKRNITSHPGHRELTVFLAFHHLCFRNHFHTRNSDTPKPTTIATSDTTFTMDLAAKTHHCSQSHNFSGGNYRHSYQEKCHQMKWYPKATMIMTPAACPSFV